MQTEFCNSNLNLEIIPVVLSDSANATNGIFSTLGVMSLEYLTGAQCHTTDGSIEIFNQSTRFLSRCVILLVGILFSVSLLGPIIYRIFDLSRHTKAQATLKGQLAFISSLLAHFSFLSYFFLGNSVPSLGESVIIACGFIASLLQYIQDGRVWVTSDEIVLYWLGVAFCYLGIALDSYLQYGMKHSVLLMATGIFSVTSFLSELTNEERSIGEESGSLDTANLFSKISMSYANDMLHKGAKGILKHDDLPKAPRQINAFNCRHGLENALLKRPEGDKYRVVLSLVDFLGVNLWNVLFLAIAYEFVSYISPSVLKLFLESIEHYTEDKSPLFVCFYYAVLLSLVPLFKTSLSIIFGLATTKTYIMSRTSLIAVIYRKSMRLSPSAREDFDSSKIMNLITVDSGQVNDFASYLPALVSAPFGVIISSYQLWVLLGPSMFTFLILYAIMTPLTNRFVTKLRTYFPRRMKIKDKRNKLTSNLFRSIKSLKLYAWEHPFYRRVVEVREDEESVILRKIAVIMAYYSSIYVTTKNVATFGVFTTFLWFGGRSLTPSIVFPALLLFDLATTPFNVFPSAISSLMQMLTSQARINDLLIQRDNDHMNYTKKRDSARGYDEKSIEVVNAIISWNGEETLQKTALRDISFQSTRGDLICIIGRVGTGKSALLRALSGNLDILSGNITIRGTVAYCTQDPWLQNLTFKENVLFGQNYDEMWYNQVLDLCQLRDDIKQMPREDETEVGERGISLSGGQKARLALARAVYSRADVYLLDDVLSAVDEHVSSHLIEDLLGKNGILGNSTIVLATNNIKVLSQASYIIELADKTVIESASLEKVISQGKNSKIYRMIEEFGNVQDLNGTKQIVEPRKPYIVQKEKSYPNFYPLSPFTQPIEIVPVNIRQSGDDDEEQEEMTASLLIFLKYFEVLPLWIYAILLGLISSATLLLSSQNILLGYMSNKGLSNIFDARWYLIGYFLVVVLGTLCLIVSILWNSIVMGLSIANIMHNRMLWNVMHAPMAFFDTTPVGRLINRFTSDINNLETTLPNTLFRGIHYGINIAMASTFIICSSPLTGFVIIPLGVIGNRIRKLYVPSQRKISRMNSAANSPILSHVEDSLKGQLVISSFDRLEQFSSIFENRIDYWIQIHTISRNISRWLRYRIELMSVLIMLTTSVSITWLLSKGIVSPGYCGVLLSFASSLGMMLHQTLNTITQLEVSSVCLDRTLEYINIGQEAPYHVEATKPDESWPSSGIVNFDRLSARYRPESPDVLKNLSFTIKGGEKIGIVGRTGSGKSTLTMTIFRILESHSGHISIDGIDISILGLTDLRSKLSIIPQDAHIFDGTVRENLDPLNIVDDAKLWEILELCHLKTHFESVEGGLDTRLADGGENLSRGQAQLICLGRALIHEAKVLVLDEATASVDVETDRIVQSTIRRNFSDRTIITIAHRINTIMDSDRILVLDFGEVKEFDTPQNLLDSEGMFYSLLQASKNADENLESTE